jgi:hypothetical protein
MQFSPWSVLLPLGPNIFNTLLSETLNLCFSLKVRDQVSNPYSKNVISLNFVCYDKYSNCSKWLPSASMHIVNLLKVNRCLWWYSVSFHLLSTTSILRATNSATVCTFA